MVGRNGCSAARVLGNERGTILIFTAVTLLVLFSVMALGIDMGQPSTELRRYVTAVRNWLKGEGPATHLPCTTNSVAGVKLHE